MTLLKAFGCLTAYCNWNMGIDDYIDNDRYQAAAKVVLDSDPDRFLWCTSMYDVLKEIHWPNVS